MPDPSQLQCPHCGQAYSVTAQQLADYAGKTINCTRCSQPFVVSDDGRTTPLPAAQPQPYAQAGGYEQPGGFQQPGGYPQQPGGVPGGGYAYVQPASNGMAVAALVCGILAFLTGGIAGILAIIFGIIGLNKTKDPQVGGKGMAIAGLICGACGMVFCGGMVFGILVPSLSRARETANRVQCAAHLRMLGTAAMMYENNNKGYLPKTIDQLDPYLTDNRAAFVCPSSGDTAAASAEDLATPGHVSYIYLGNGQRATRFGISSVLMYEPLSNHGHGGRGSGSNFLYGDGHVEFVPQPTAGLMIQELEAGKNPPPSASSRPPSQY